MITPDNGLIMLDISKSLSQILSSKRYFTLHFSLFTFYKPGLICKVYDGVFYLIINIHKLRRQKVRPKTFPKSIKQYVPYTYSLVKADDSDVDLSPPCS